MSATALTVPQLQPREVARVNTARHIAERTIAVLERERVAGLPKKPGLPVLYVWPHPGRCVLMMEPLAVRDHVKLTRKRTCDILARTLRRRVVVTDYDRIFIQVAYHPEMPRLIRLPSGVPLDLSALPPEPYRVLFGTGDAGDVTLDLSVDHRAILAGGYTGSGKSNLIKSVLLQLARKHPPAEVQVALCDLKRVDFGPLTPYATLPHLYSPIAYSLEQATTTIEEVYGEFLRRQVLMARAGVDDWRKLPDDERVPLLLLIVDEIARLAETPAMATLCDLGREGRAMGISILAATQHPTSDVIDTQLKANLPTCLAFQTRTELESRTILGRKGAEDLRNVGRALGFLDGRWQQVQTLGVADGIAESLLGLPAVPVQAPVLAPVEAALVRYAVEHLDGAFTVNRLYDALRTGGLKSYGAKFGDISKDKITELGRRWQARGWLTTPGRNENGHKVGRCVTSELLRLAGISEALSATSEGNSPPTPPKIGDRAPLSDHASLASDITTPEKQDFTRIDQGKTDTPTDELPSFLQDRVKPPSHTDK